MDDRRGSDFRPGGNASRSLSSNAQAPLPKSRQSTQQEMDSDSGQMSLSRTLGEAWYTYGKMRDAEQEKRITDGEYQKQSQHFDNNLRLREVLETRKNKCDQIFQTARSDYNKAAQQAEPILRRMTESPPPSISNAIIEEIVRKAMRRELEKFPSFREMRDALGDLEDKIVKRTANDIRAVVKRELRDYTHSSEFRGLSDQVRDLTLRGRQTSVSSDTSREKDYRTGAHPREVENVRQELSSRQQDQGREIASLNDRLNTLNTQQKEIMVQQDRRIQMPTGARSEDIVKIESALLKAQEVMNDQYVTLQDFRVQLDSVVEGIRVLNEHIEEYDKRLESLQTSTQQIIGEVQAENNRRNKVICQALDSMHDKITTEVNSKLDTVPPSPSSALTSPHVDSPRPGFPPSFPNNNTSTNAINTQISDLKNHVTQLTTAFQTVQASHFGLQNQVGATLNVPAQMQSFINDVHARLQLQLGQEQINADAIRTLQAKFNNIWESYQNHVQNSDNNFKETAIHMDSVKKRFAEHRRTLDDLITAWKDSTSKLLELQQKFEALKDFTSTKLVPTIANLSRKSSPTTTDPNRLRRAAITSGNNIQNNTQNNGSVQGEGGGQNDGTGGAGVADNPIEL